MIVMPCCPLEMLRSDPSAVREEVEVAWFEQSLARVET